MRATENDIKQLIMIEGWATGFHLLYNDTILKVFQMSVVK